MAHLGDFRLRIDKNGKSLDTEVYENLGKRNIHSIFWIAPIRSGPASPFRK